MEPKYSFSVSWLCLFFALISIQCCHGQDSSITKNLYADIFTPDKGQHFLAGLMLTVAAVEISKYHFNQDNGVSKQIGAGGTFSLGVIKELYDSQQQGNHFSWKDLAAGIGGICLGFIIAGIP